jgi:alkylation response protein AidB-like acyl-CoA dehydrogenase
MQMRAVREGDEFVLNGQKRFITSADFADYLWVAARTDPNLPKHKGISLFVADIKTPGVTVRPMYCMNGERTNEVFFDNVRVPGKNLVGELNRGWYYISEALDYERFAVISFTPVEKRFERLVEWVKSARINGTRLKDDKAVRRALAKQAIRVSIGRMLNLRCIAKAAEPNYVPTIEAAMNRAWSSLVGPEIDDLALDLAGPCGYLWEGEDAPDGGEFCKMWTMGPHARTAAAGLDVSKNIIAKRMLRLPS